ncbi:MAG: cohesin domain-containing protein, partial [Candidatus Poribacteria bacterium]|nr:cohesin domain-containing protein [Candidatus Poribacteria bacterium]
LSCIGCHTEGMKVFEDEVRGVVEQNPNPPFDKDRALRLYTDQATMDVLVAEDTQRYREALWEAGGVFGGIEPIQRFHEAFQGPVDAAHAAAAVGSETADFLEKIRENASLKNLGLAVLTGGSGTVKRDVWTSNFDEIVTTLSSPVSTVIKPIVPQTERVPGEAVHIPDPNLRDTIAEALGKPAGAVITVEDMSTLRYLEAPGMDIQNLEGLQFATNLEELRLRGNPLSDLSPLSGLTTLKEVEISGESLSDLSPLESLPNLEGLGFWETSISDLSPLKELTKLRWLVFVGSPISDLSPLVGLTSLKRLETYGSKEPNLLPLKGLTSLVRLRVAGSGVSDISPLAGLINLEELELFANKKISDVSPLGSLRKLRRLRLDTNKITDVLPLTGLSNLEELYLQRNNILDVSPLDGLRENTEIHWFSNPGFRQGGPKIEGPWLWVLVSGVGFDAGVDLLSQASDGAATELEIATTGATEGSPVGESVWTPHKIAPMAVDGGNISSMLNVIGIERSHENMIYGSLVLYSPREQKITMFAGSDGAHKIWLNGELVSKKLNWWVWAHEYQNYFPVTLKQGTNVLLVGVYAREHWEFSGFFGFAPEAEYMVVSPGTGFAFSTDTTSVRVGDTFTLRVNTEKVTDLAGWQFDLTFNPDVLEVVEVNEGDFLKTDGGTTFFQEGTVDNTEGKIAGLSAALISKGGVPGTGTLLSVVFSAKADGNSQLTLHNFQLGSSTGAVIPAGVRDLAITVESKPSWDVNADGQVSVLDLILVAQRLGETVSANSKFDVNDDGIISILDLILVAQHLGESTVSAAPSMIAEELNPAMIQAWIAQAQVENDGSIAFQQGIANLQRLLASLIPEETALLPNYPNPFNPETWIPYQLSEPAEVTLTIYAVNGTKVRILALGLMPAGIYQSRSRAAYWDGKNNVGESVASGVYFYTLTAAEFISTRKMLIRK